MDVYAGHSWANGPAQFEQGNNEEASSEDLNFSSSVILWGAATRHTWARDLGIFLFANQVAAVEQYWFDVDHAVFPRGFQHVAAAMVWGAGAKYDTWFDQDPVFVHGINFLPFTGASLYLGRHPDYVKRNVNEVMSESRGVVTTWRDYIAMYLALAEPQKAMGLLRDDPYLEPEFGNARATTLHWISNLQALGEVETSVTADVPTFAVFKQGAARAHVAWSRRPSLGLSAFRTARCSAVLPNQIAVARSNNPIGWG